MNKSLTRMKIIFLDVDGVLRTQRSILGKYETPNRVDPECITQLNRITTTTKAKIVVSSSWRQGGFKYITGLLKLWGVTSRVISITPVFLSLCRGTEIKTWFKNKELNYQNESFVILDDDNDMEELTPYLLQSNFDVGLTKELADEAIRRFTR